MNLSNTKKTQLKNLLVKACQGWSNSYIVTLYQRIIDIYENKKERSEKEIDQFKKYFAFCAWIAVHLGPCYGIRFWDKDTVHILFRQVQNISSIAWDKLGPEEFSQYFYDIKKWCATVVFKIEYKDMIQSFNDDMKPKEYDKGGNLIQEKKK